MAKYWNKNWAIGNWLQHQMGLGLLISLNKPSLYWNL
jgi:hypothetical protein